LVSCAQHEVSIWWGGVGRPTSFHCGDERPGGRGHGGLLSAIDRFLMKAKLNRSRRDKGPSITIARKLIIDA